MKRVIIVSAVLVATAGFAQTGQQSPQGEGGVSPTDTICRTVKDTGTRLGRTRVCMSRAEWTQHRRDTKQSVERAQTQRVEKQF